jgi:hypothetical protein
MHRFYKNFAGSAKNEQKIPVMVVRPHLSYPKPLNRFPLNFVLLANFIFLRSGLTETLIYIESNWKFFTLLKAVHHI